jgi:hypothetical protein
MSPVAIPISEEDWQYVERVARDSNATPVNAAARLLHDAVRSRKDWEKLQQRAARGAANPKTLKQLLAEVPDAPPIPGDELPEGWELNKH